MIEEYDGVRKSLHPGVQAAAALVLVGGVLGGMWGLGIFNLSSAAASKPAVCSVTPATPATPAAATADASAGRLCAALNRSDLPVLLGTPGDHLLNASGSTSTFTSAGGSQSRTPQADVQTTTYSLKLTGNDDDLTVAEAVPLLGGTAQQTTVLGHPAVLYSNRTIAFSLGGGGTRPGGIARTLMVARSAKDGGGSFEIALWRQDDVLPDDNALRRVAEQVLPTLPGWTNS
jgi:hypothetical protein